jgi:hypothetical protein
MGYLDKATITVDAILTNLGRERLAEGGVNNSANSFNITKFAVADDEIDYGLYNVTHPNGTAFWGSIIENMPVLEATPDEQQIMRYKLITLDGTLSEIRIPFIKNVKNINIAGSATLDSFIVETGQQEAATSVNEPYVLIVGNARLCDIIIGQSTTPTNQTPVANPEEAVNANGAITIQVGAVQRTIVFRRRTNITGETTATIFGVNTGATATFNIKVS